MGRHQRRGYVGQTNLPSPHKHAQHEQGPRSVPSTRIERSEAVSPPPQTQSRKRQLRAKWKLDVGPVPRGLEPLHFSRHERGDMPPEQVLAANIEAAQQDRKSFKNESWYRSPIGAGSKSSVILAALKQHDHTDTGFLPRTRIQETLQHRQFGLSEPEIHALLARFDPTQQQIHYNTFVQQLHFAEPPVHPDGNDIIFRHERYLEKIRDHATRLLDNAGSGDASSPLRLSPFKHTMVTNNEPTVVLGISPPRRLPPLADVGESPSPKRTDEDGDDRLSFVHDKERRAQRARAKAAALLAHISRVDAYARHQDAVAVQQESLRIAHKAIHHGEHLARVYNQEHHQLYRLEHQGKKVLFASPAPVAQRSVSKDSMFYVNPKDGRPSR